MKLQRGFTLVEVLIYAATLSITAGLLTAILSNTVRVQTREANSIEIAQQLNFTLETVTNLVNESALIEKVYEGNNPNNACTQFCTLKLRMTASSTDPTYVSSNASGIYLTQGNNATSTLTGAGVTVNRFQLTKYEFGEGHSSVKIDLAMTMGASNPQFAVTRSIQSAIGRAAAATFDSDLLPSGSWNVGQSGTPWVNGFFSGNLTVDTNTLFVDSANNRVGVSTTTPTAKLHVVAPNLTDNSGYNFIFDNQDVSAAQGSGLLVKGGANNASSTTFGVQDLSGNTDFLVRGDGNVGIGTTTPSYKLDVDNGATNTYPINLVSSSKFVRIGALNSTYAHVDTDAASGFYFYDPLTTGAGNSLLNISSGNSYLASAGGNVGIGTTTPAYKLEVTGTLKATDFYSGDGTIGMTGSCGATTTITVKDGLITSCS